MLFKVFGTSSKLKALAILFVNTKNSEFTIWAFWYWGFPIKQDETKLFFLTILRPYFFCDVCHAFESVHCCLLVTSWERTDPLALFVMFNCVFVLFPCGILGQVRYLIVSIPDICTLSYSNKPDYKNRNKVGLVKRRSIITRALSDCENKILDQNSHIPSPFCVQQV